MKWISALLLTLFSFFYLNCVQAGGPDTGSFADRAYLGIGGDLAFTTSKGIGDIGLDNVDGEPTIFTNSSGDGVVKSLGLSVILGISRVFSNQFYLAGELFYVPYFGDTSRFNSGGTSYDDGAGGNVKISGGSLAKIDNLYGFRITPGLLIQDHTLLFLVIGATAARIKQVAEGKYQFTNVFNVGTRTFNESFGSSESHVIGPTVGIGLERHMLKNLSLRLVYLFSYFPSSSSSSSGTVNNGEVPSNGQAGATGVFFAARGASGGERILNHEILLTAIIRLNP